MMSARKKKLPPYGDYDKDGAPNWSDCDPYDPDEQGVFKRAAHIVTRGRVGQSKEEYEAEKLEKQITKEKLEELKKQAEAAGIEVKETGLKPQIEAVVKGIADTGTPDPGVRGMQKILYGQPTPQHQRVYRARPQPQMQPQQPQPEYYPQQDEYTYKSHYYGRKGYLYLPSVKRPQPHRHRRAQAVNPFKRSQRMFANAGLRHQPLRQTTCYNCGYKSYAYKCPKCGAYLE